MIENMAIEDETQAAADIGDDPVVFGTPDIVVHTDAVDVCAIAMHDLPVEMVLAAMTMPEPFKTVHTMGMFNLALGADSTKLELASFNEAHDAMSLWIAGSNRKRRKHVAEMVAKYPELGEG